MEGEQLTIWREDPRTYRLYPQHTVKGEYRREGWPYGTTHDMSCPGCQDIPFTLSPRSETYWAS
jgi:hypothetical protein